MVAKDDDSELLLLVLLLLESSATEEDSYLRHEVYERVRRRLKESRYYDPLIDHLIERREFFPIRTQERFLSQSRDVASSVLEEFRRSFEESTNHKIDQLSYSIESIKSQTAGSLESINSKIRSIESYRQSSQDYLWLLSSGADISQVELTRYLPIRVYVADPLPDKKILNEIVHSVESILDSVGFEKTDDFPEEGGSWWKKLAVKTKGFFTQDEVAAGLEKAKRAAEIAALDKPQAEANLCQAQAASSLIRSLESTKSACVQAGSLLVVKVSNQGKSAIVVRTLTPIELKRLEENQAVLRKPNEIIDWLESSGEQRLTNKSGRPPAASAD